MFSRKQYVIWLQSTKELGDYDLYRKPVQDCPDATSHTICESQLNCFRQKLMVVRKNILGIWIDFYKTTLSGLEKNYSFPKKCICKNCCFSHKELLCLDWV
jgi:hypothetical protein